MAWTFTGKDSKTGKSTATFALALGASKRRYTDLIDFIPAGANFTIISNSAQTDLSASASDSMYACATKTGTFVQVKKYLRRTEVPYSQGTSVNSIDNAIRPRYWYYPVDGEWGYYKLSVLQSGVESSAKVVTFTIVY